MRPWQGERRAGRRRRVVFPILLRSPAPVRQAHWPARGAPRSSCGSRPGWQQLRAGLVLTRLTIPCLVSQFVLHPCDQVPRLPSWTQCRHHLVGPQTNLDSNSPSVNNTLCELGLVAVPLWTLLFLSARGRGGLQTAAPDEPWTLCRGRGVGSRTFLGVLLGLLRPTHSPISPL